MINRRHSCSDCTHESEIDFVSLTDLPCGITRKVPSHEMEVLVPVLDADTKAMTMTEGSVFPPQKMYALVFERHRQTGPSRWEFKFKGVREL